MRCTCSINIPFCAVDVEAYSSDASKGIGDVKSSTLGVMEEDCIMDTVGVICIDRAGHVASGASSGGIAMKVLNLKLLLVISQSIMNKLYFCAVLLYSIASVADTYISASEKELLIYVAFSCNSTLVFMFNFP